MFFLIFVVGRRKRDSNSRYLLQYDGFQDRCIQPLCHFSSCKDRTQTCDLRVMSPTSYQLLHLAIFKVSPPLSLRPYYFFLGNRISTHFLTKLISYSPLLINETTTQRAINAAHVGSPSCTAPRK